MHIHNISSNSKQSGNDMAEPLPPFLATDEIDLNQMASFCWWQRRRPKVTPFISYHCVQTPRFPLQYKSLFSLKAPKNGRGAMQIDVPHSFEFIVTINWKQAITRVNAALRAQEGPGSQGSQRPRLHEHV